MSSLFYRIGRYSGGDDAGADDHSGAGSLGGAPAAAVTPQGAVTQEGASAMSSSSGAAGGDNAAATSDRYCAEALGAALKNVPTEGKNMEDLEIAVKKVCAQHGVKIARGSSKKEKGEGGRLVMVTWKCVHGMRNRQSERRGRSPGAHQLSRKSSSQRTGCDFRFTARWPLRCPVNRHPRLTAMQLEHLHEVDTTAMDVEGQMKAPLSSAMRAEAAKLAGAGLVPSVQAKVLTALHDRRVDTRDIQNAASQQSGGELPYDAQELLEKVQECTKAGGVYKVKFDSTGRFSHVFWMTAEQVSLAARYGTVLLYDDTAVKNRYRLPLGLGVIIDGDFYTRIAFQTITADSTNETFQWLLEAFLEARGAAPDVFIQAVDVALAAEAQKVFPLAIKRRCIWHLMEGAKKGLGEVLGAAFPAFLDTLLRVRGRPTESGFDEDFAKLLAAYPQSEEFLKVLYDDRERWAEAFSSLTFGVSSWTTDRVEGMIARVRRFCNAKTTLANVFRFLENPIESPIERSALRNAQLHISAVPPAVVSLPPAAAHLPQIAPVLPRTAPILPRIVRIPPQTAKNWFGGELTKPLQFGLRTWALRFMEDEMDAAFSVCSSSSSGNSLVDGSDLEKVLGKMEYLGGMVADVESVACIVETRDGVEMEHTVLAMKGGSHLCSCRTLQTLGLCCRHFWMSMRLSRAFRFHVGILHKHWLSEQAWIPMADWPTTHQSKWSVALNHNRLDGAEAGRTFARYRQRSGVGGRAAALPHERPTAARGGALPHDQTRSDAVGGGGAAPNQMKSYVVEGGAVALNQIRLDAARGAAAALNHQGSVAAGGAAAAASLNHMRSNEGTGGGGGSGVTPTEMSSRWKAIAESASIGYTLTRLKEEGPTVLDRRMLYADMLRQLTVVVERGVETVDPQAMRGIMAALKSQVDAAVRVSQAAGVDQAGGGSYAAGVPQTATVEQTADINQTARIGQAVVIGQAAGVDQASRVHQAAGNNGAGTAVAVGAAEAARLPTGWGLGNKRHRSGGGESKR